MTKFLGAFFKDFRQKCNPPPPKTQHKNKIFPFIFENSCKIVLEISHTDVQLSEPPKKKGVTN